MANQRDCVNLIASQLHNDRVLPCNSIRLSETASTPKKWREQKKNIRSHPLAAATQCVTYHDYLACHSKSVLYVTPTHNTLTMQTIATGTLNINSIAVESAQTPTLAANRELFFGSPNIFLMEFFSAAAKAAIGNRIHRRTLFAHFLAFVPPTFTCSRHRAIFSL